jgi:hypothetical protein
MPAAITHHSITPRGTDSRTRTTTTTRTRTKRLVKAEVNRPRPLPASGAVPAFTALAAFPIPAFPIDVPTYPAEFSQVGILASMKNQFKTLRASSLYCQRCKVARPVRERLLLVLPDRELYDYLCTECGSSVGSREVKAAASDRPSLII